MAHNPPPRHYRPPRAVSTPIWEKRKKYSLPRASLVVCDSGGMHHPLGPTTRRAQAPRRLHMRGDRLQMHASTRTYTATCPVYSRRTSGPGNREEEVPPLTPSRAMCVGMCCSKQDRMAMSENMCRMLSVFGPSVTKRRQPLSGFHATGRNGREAGARGPHPSAVRSDRILRTDELIPLCVSTACFASWNPSIWPINARPGTTRASPVRGEVDFGIQPQPMPYLPLSHIPAYLPTDLATDLPTSP